VTRSLTQCSRLGKLPQTLGVSTLYRLLGKQIAYFRDRADLTQEELAEKTDYSVDFISLVERGVNAPTVARLQDIAKALGVDVWQLFYPLKDEATDASAGRVKASRTANHGKGGR